MTGNKTELYDLTIVVPVYNEEDNIYNLEKKLNEYLPAALVKSCVLFVNDGSKDKSKELLNEICARNNHFYQIDFQKNAGLSAAMG